MSKPRPRLTLDRVQELFEYRDGEPDQQGKAGAVFLCWPPRRLNQRQWIPADLG